ncbi:uncharacterized protein LOC124622070 isoform X2 [Schistocerca americana]|uniref:uncharacterized protein LOC124622070 isoform X2 n=1 Tax=Schistocerca americana TaxID=7009 RepID=UPI001F4FCC0C|nr:uncharacterized protein LOC124622070 isoform X2 [Schistocerca americana]
MALRVNVFLFQQTNVLVVAAGLRTNSILQRSASTKPEKEPACSKTERMAKKLREKTPIELAVPSTRRSITSIHIPAGWDTTSLALTHPCLFE